MAGIDGLVTRSPRVAATRDGLIFQPQLHEFEGRVVPAAFSALLPNGTSVSGTFSTPAGVDPTQASQSIAIPDLSVTQNSPTATATTDGDGGSSPPAPAYTVQPGATADYQYGVLVGVTAVATGGAQAPPPPGGPPGSPGAPGGSSSINLTDGTVTVGGYSAPVAYDPADTQVTFTLPDGTVGAISITIPWDQVDPTQANQTLAPTALNLNIAGQNFTLGQADYTAGPPQLLFSNGNFEGVDFNLNPATTAPGFAYSNIVLNGLNATINAANGQQFLVNAPVALTMLSLDFSDAGTAGYTYDLTIKVAYSGAATKEVTITVTKGTTAGGLLDAVQTALASVGVDATEVGGTRLKMRGYTVKITLQHRDL